MTTQGRKFGVPPSQSPNIQDPDLFVMFRHIQKVKVATVHVIIKELLHPNYSHLTWVVSCRAQFGLLCKAFETSDKMFCLVIYCDSGEPTPRSFDADSVQAKMSLYSEALQRQTVSVGNELQQGQVRSQITVLCLSESTSKLNRVTMIDNISQCILKTFLSF